MMSVRERDSGGSAAAALVIGAPADGRTYEEFSRLVDEIESDQRLGGNLDEIPRFRQPRMLEDAVGPVSRDSLPGVSARSERSGKASAQMAVPAVVYRDKDDVRTILNMTSVLMVLAVLLVASAVANVFQYYRRPDRIVVDGGSGRVLSINDRNYGKEDGVEFGPDRLTKQDKIYITREFVSSVYKIDPATRPRDMERALTMMVPDSAVKFAAWMRDKGLLDQQKAESWQTLWTPMDVTVDRNDPYTVTVIGRQDITRVVSAAVVKESKQLRLTVKLVADPKGRADRNLRSGFLISSLDYYELSGAEGTPAASGSGSPAASSAAGEGSRQAVTPVSALQER